MHGIIFNGIDSDNHPYLYFNKIGRPITAPIETKYIKVPGLKGAIFAGQEVDVLYIPAEVTIKGKTAANVEQLKRSIAGWLKVREPKPLVIKREPDKTYYAVLSESSDIDLIVSTGKGQITFLCLDPIAEGVEREQVINGSGTIVENNGTEEAYPLIEATFTQDSPFLAIVSPDDQIILGRPLDVEETEIEREQLLLHDTCTTTNGWAVASEVDQGIVSGEMVSDGAVFLPNDYGMGSGWHGPSIKKSLPEPLQDFRLDVLLTQRSAFERQVGRVDVYLLNANSERIFRVSMRDTTATSELNRAEIRAGTLDVQQKLLYEYGHFPGIWNDWLGGLLRLERVGDRLLAYVARIREGGEHAHRRIPDDYIDIYGLFQEEITQVQVHIAQYSDYEPTIQSIGDIKVYKINEPGALQLPYIARTGATPTKEK